MHWALSTVILSSEKSGVGNIYYNLYAYGCSMHILGDVAKKTL